MATKKERLIAKGEAWFEEVFIPTIAPLYFPNVAQFDQVFNEPGENQYRIDNDVDGEGTPQVMCTIKGSVEEGQKIVEAFKTSTYDKFAHPFEIATKNMSVDAEILGGDQEPDGNAELMFVLTIYSM